MASQVSLPTSKAVPASPGSYGDIGIKEKQKELDGGSQQGDAQVGNPAYDFCFIGEGFVHGGIFFVVWCWFAWGIH